VTEARFIAAVLAACAALPWSTPASSQAIAERVTRIEVSVGDDSCYVAPVTDSTRVLQIIQFINAELARPAPALSIGLGGVHAELYRDTVLIASFGAGVGRRGFEFFAGGSGRAWTAPPAALDAFLRLLGLPPGTNAGLGLPGHCKPHGAGSS